MKFILSAIFCMLTVSCSAAPRNITLSTKNSVTLRAAVTAKSVAYVIEELAKLDRASPKDEPLYLVLDTPGGNIKDGYTLIEYIRGLKREIKTISIFAASMGFMIQQSAGERLVLETSILMSHPAATGCQGNVYEIKTCLVVLESLNNTLIKIASERMKMKPEDYTKMVEHDKWFNSVEALFFNAADRVITINCSDDLIKNKITIETETFFGTFKEEYSACPFLNKPLK